MRRALTAALIAAGVVGGLVPAGASAKSVVNELHERAFTVVAVVDTGINPYHLDFRAPELTVHPSRYVEGFPADAPALHLSLNSNDLEDALDSDAEDWARVPEAKPVWIPGTNIIAALNVGGREQRFFDTTDHGTATASLAAGRIHGPGSEDLLIVAINDWDFGFKWAVRQPWIDVITNSWANALPYPFEKDVAQQSRRATRDGKVVCFSSGNDASVNAARSTSGPSWTVNVGSASKATRGDHAYSNYPNDVLGFSQVEAAANDSMDGTRLYAGTSFAAPSVCGQVARVIAEARAAVGDHTEGPDDRALVTARDPSRGSLKDGRLMRLEIERAIQAAARPPETSLPDPSNDPWAIPALPLVSFLRDGYGIVDRSSANLSLSILFGREPWPDREIEDRWAELVDGIRDTLWE